MGFPLNGSSRDHADWRDREAGRDGLPWPRRRPACGREGRRRVNRRAKLTPDRRPKLTPLMACTTGSARPGGTGRGCGAGAIALDVFGEPVFVEERHCPAACTFNDRPPVAATDWSVVLLPSACLLIDDRVKPLAAALAAEDFKVALRLIGHTSNPCGPP